MKAPKIDSEVFVNLRRHLHAHPEVSEKEYGTQEYIFAFLKELGYSEIFKVGKTGLLLKVSTKNPGKRILIRVDIDALPIREKSNLDYRSKKEGVAHLCGHDGHTAIGCALASMLYTQAPEKGEIYIVFQPAEENGIGAAAVISDEVFSNLQFDAVLALHNLPGYPLHSVVVREGSFTAAATSFIIRLHGKTSHAAEPEKGINPAYAIAEMLQKTAELSVPELEKPDFALVTPVYMALGEKSYGVSAGYGELHLTLRAWDNDNIDRLSRDIEKTCLEIAEKHQLETETDWVETFRANINDPELIHHIRTAAKELDLNIIERNTAFKWGEDFGLFTERFRGAMFGIGAGEKQPALHNPDYDFPDALIETGSNVFYTMIYKILSEN
ncbi:MAG: amidohydrolase [Cyclobacteriaceae bacterium]|nr:amidohydrolase [Cyclobacteriaceae bacterium]